MLTRFTRFFIVVALVLIALTSVVVLQPPIKVYLDPWTGNTYGGDGDHQELFPILEKGSERGGVIMPKLGNATAKAELGKATWKLLHTITLRYPDNPTPDERQALSSYFYLFSRLYPCGECAKEFQMLLKENPPQTSSRKAASLWLCYVHNLVNDRLKKPQFDCNLLDSTYDCGCGDPNTSSQAINPSSMKDDITNLDMIHGG
ncbi:hypothetical protein FRC03_006469 [Tulasnella sp. 419]|nr:hypothetical protein FRC02_004555 [Tulasnella sp. 418]KAG8960512.1 hypothetical protein FRC03_006469 [Tulasnella sp. 419]